MDDEGVVRELLTQMLTSKNIKVTTAPTVKEGLGRLRKKNFDLIIVGAELPGADRPVLIKKIRKEWKEIPLVLMTERDVTEGLEKVEGQNIELLVGKPLDLDGVVKQIYALLGESHLR